MGVGVDLGGGPSGHTPKGDLQEKIETKNEYQDKTILLKEYLKKNPQALEYLFNPKFNNRMQKAVLEVGGLFRKQKYNLKFSYIDSMDGEEYYVLEFEKVDIFCKVKTITRDEYGLLYNEKKNTFYLKPDNCGAQ